MKKLTSLFAIILLAVTSLSLTSCEDEMIASTLEGTWEGNMYISLKYHDRYYDATYSEVCFLRNPLSFTSGEGYWVDHYASDAPWRYIANHIYWTVSDGCIKVCFREEGTTIYIEDYTLSDSRFKGYIIDGDNRVRFSLRHVSSPNWNDYDYWGYGAWDYGDYGWSKGNTRSAGDNAAGDTVSVEKPQRVVRMR